jgi:hypothetical protein|tara:strand:+ start:2594 stop:3163 length:570 start_codon:yes stop_codon:yes gene_type:complete
MKPINSKPKIIALAGPKGVGKSFVAGKLAKALGAQILSYADPIRAALSAIGVSFDDKNVIQHPFGKSARFIAQTFGTEWGRGMISDSLWLDLMEKRIGETPGVIVIDDARFDNEAKQVSRLGGLVVELYGDTSEEDGDLHASEVGISPFLIDNQFYNSRYNKTLALDSILSILNVDQELQEWEDSQLYD